MSYKIGLKGSSDCSGYPVLKEGTNKVIGCHPTKAEALSQILAIIRKTPISE